jgi:hypothetical protein
MALDREHLIDLQRRLADDGKLIEAGWIGLRLAAIDPEAPDIQLREMRNAFFAGAQHLFAAINDVLDEDSEPTVDDLYRMTKIDAELRTFAVEFCRENGLPDPTGQRQ